MRRAFWSRDWEANKLKMSRQFVTVSEISISHGFYTDGSTSDLVFRPTTDTSALLRKYRLLFGAKSKFSLSSYVLLQETVGGTPLIALPAAYQLRFAIDLKNSSFMNFTDLPSLGSREVFFFENQSAGTGLYDTTPDKMELVGAQFAWEGIAGGTAQVRAEQVDTGDSVTVDTFTETDPISLANVVKVRFNLAGMPPGRYRLYRDAEVNHDKEVYFDASLAGKDIWGILHLTESASLDVVPAYTLSFDASVRRWKYFLVLKGDHGNASYTVTDESQAGTLSFDEQSVVSPAYALTSADQKILATLDGAYNSAPVQVMVSEQDIAYREQARASLQLNRVTPVGNGPTTTSVPVVTNLPNPGAGVPHAGVVVCVDPPA